MIPETQPEEPGRTPILDKRTRTIVATLALSGMVLLAAYGFVFVIVQSLHPGQPDHNWILSVLHKQYAAALGVPSTAVAALCIVLLLETVAGPMEIETPWLKFKGAAVPVIFWMCCFLVMTWALGWLWIKEPTPEKTSLRQEVPGTYDLCKPETV